MTCPASLQCLGPAESPPPPSAAPEAVTTLRVLVGEDPPFTYHTTGLDGNVTSAGYAIDVLKVLAKEVGFRYQLEWLQGTQFGVQLENGSWTGMIRQLQDGGADLALSWFALNPSRLQVMDFLDEVPIRTYWNALFVRQTSRFQTESMLGALTKPLGVDVWLSLLATLLVVSLVLWLVLRASRSEPPESRRDYSPGACLLSIYGGFMMQGYVRTPASAAGRIVVISHWAMCIIVYATYTAQLASFLTATNVSPLLSSVDQVATQTQYPLVVDKTSASVEAMRLSSDAAYRALYRRIIHNDNVLDMSLMASQGRDVVPDDAVLYLDYDRLVYYLRERSCLYQPVVEVNYKHNPAYVGARRGLPQKPALNRALRKMTESGLLQRLWKRHFVSSFVCEQAAAAPSLGADQLQAILLVVPFGTAAALLWVLAECGWRRCQPRQIPWPPSPPAEDLGWHQYIDPSARAVIGRRRNAWHRANGKFD
ncbi:glutamate receptor ionotropic, kainate 2-like [Amphibalanus amphitrite]|uniref:glutamate receptor ionotropic, kainate 2-like n=1 Tax=Amphibalanus amphitrite TaxID=1232801 RepID=UPI001C8FCFE0|nr:glutamate receptor ionotropic, kainate 2-like [Amphibalanus amphitrite]